MSLGVAAAAAAGGLLAAALGWAFGVEPYRVRQTRLRLVCRRLPPEFEGFTLLQLSDLHMAHMGRRERQLARLVRGLRPDLVALTGDLAYDGVAARQILQIVEGAQPRLGTYAVSGNADVRHPLLWDGVVRALERGGVRLMRNEHTVLCRAGARITIAGVEDPHSGLDDLNHALSGAPDGCFTLLLAHSPAIAHPAVEMGVDAVLCGHTHGGQLVLPVAGPLLTRSGYGTDLASGLFRGGALTQVVGTDAGDTQVYVSRGVGTSFLPLRLLCPPEVTLVELHRAG